MALVEETGASARAAASLTDALAAVLEAVGLTTGWPAGHAWVTDGEGHWVSSGLWSPDDPIGLGALRRACVEAPSAPPAGHLALALRAHGTQWVPDLSAMLCTARYEAAAAQGLRSALACPVYAHDRPVAILEWFLASGAHPAPDVVNALGHLSAVLSEVAERPVVAPSRRADLREEVRPATEDGVPVPVLT